ncbi:hypothetical protein N7507_004055 [Penicillium longicatenatum]|nr:hypothetical protein N7507_004055 [Penicillium longicatenatum]
MAKGLKPLHRAWKATNLTHRIHTQPLHTASYLQAEKIPAAKAEEVILERCILNPERTESCQSGTDDEVARHNSPYAPFPTSPEKEHLALEEEYRLEGDTRHNPLLVSPANVDVSLILDPRAEVAHSLHHLRSVKGWTNKHKEVLLLKTPYEFRKYEHVFSELRKPNQMSLRKWWNV